MELARCKKNILYNFFLPNNEEQSPDGVFPSKLDSIFEKKNPLWKRGIDIFGSLFGLIICFPLFLIIGIFIKTVSPGPVFFKQKRIGCGGKPFNCLKFRTMTTNVDTKIHKEYLAKLICSSQEKCNPGQPMEKLHHDPRIIKYGNFLRASGLDELPQLINILMGQMSIIGPRPPIPYEVEKYQNWYKGRLDVVPGLTGLWQVSGKNKLGFNEMVRLDIKYSMQRSFLLDCKIVLKTPIAIFSQVKELMIERSVKLEPNVEN